MNRVSQRKSTKVSILGDTDDDSPDSLRGATILGELAPDGAAVKVVDAKSIKVMGAMARSQDTEALRTKQSSFLSLFRDPVVTANSNTRVSRAEWGGTNPHFVSKLLVICCCHPTLLIFLFRAHLLPTAIYYPFLL
jgi:hypothetical protein